MRKESKERRIVSTQILIQWSDSPKMEITDAYMPDGLTQEFDEWLSDIEYEENNK